MRRRPPAARAPHAVHAPKVPPPAAGRHHQLAHHHARQHLPGPCGRVHTPASSVTSRAWPACTQQASGDWSKPLLSYMCALVLLAGARVTWRLCLSDGAPCTLRSAAGLPARGHEAARLRARAGARCVGARRKGPPPQAAPAAPAAGHQLHVLVHGRWVWAWAHVSECV